MILLVCISAAEEWTSLGEYRVIGTHAPGMTTDTDGGDSGQALVIDQRLRLGVDGKAGDWRFAAESDFLSGQVIGDTWGVRGEDDDRRRWALDSFSLAGIAPRRLSGGVDTAAGKFDLGLTTSNWGLGLVANDGASDPLFGRSDFGDRVFRLRYATRPGEQWTLVAAADLVAADDSADVLDGQAAGQGVVALLHGAKSPTTLGVYGVFRHQVENAFDPPGNERVTDVGVLDAYARVQRPVGRWTAELGVEGAGIVGRTARSASYNARDGLDVLAGGAAARLAATDAKQRLGLHLRGGVASGDGHPDDGASNAFTFDRDYDVGLVLFDEVQGALDAAAYGQLSNPEYSGQAPDGADALVSEGALRGAAYVQPAVVVNARPWLAVRLGAVVAWSMAPVAQPFESFRNGGVPTNHLGVETSGYYLGSEVDWALVVGDTAPPGGNPLAKPNLRPSLWVQGGHGFLSEDLGGGRVDVVSLAARLRI